MQYGSAVQVEYLDMADEETQVRFSEIYDLAQEHHLPYPLVLINDELRITGSVNFYQIAPIVERALEQKVPV
jgi:disulfide oxidoreductase YuzD